MDRVKAKWHKGRQSGIPDLRQALPLSCPVNLGSHFVEPDPSKTVMGAGQITSNSVPGLMILGL